MGQLVKQHKIILIVWAYPVFILTNFTLALVGTNLENCDMQFVKEIFSPTYLLNNTVETVYAFE